VISAACAGDGVAATRKLDNVTLAIVVKVAAMECMNIAFPSLPAIPQGDQASRER
jgi:hypothetical protein